MHPSRWTLPLAALTALCCGFCSAANAQTPAPAVAAPSCNAAEFRQFDFWLGKWSVTEDGQPAGRNDIEPDLNRCALFESWHGVDSTAGRSVNFYDRGRKQWHQTWIDDHGGALFLDGGLVGASMVLEGTRPDAKDGSQVRHRITWTPLKDGSVRQHWEKMVAGKSTWENVFDGLYKKPA